MDRCAIFVDAGYLYAEGGKLCCGTPSRPRFTVDVAALNLALRDAATERTGLAVLRTYWYDGARDGIPTASQQAVAALPNVKLRLGRLNVRKQQKGVDALIYRDLMTLSRERAIAEAFLLSGDEDLREGVRAAQDQGVRVTVIGVRPVRDPSNQSRELLHEADEVIIFDETDIGPFFSLSPRPLPHAAPEGDICSVGRRFARNWMTNAVDDDVKALVSVRPKIPQLLDAELLRFAEGELGVALRGNQDARRQLRKGFWDGIASDPTEVDSTEDEEE